MENHSCRMDVSWKLFDMRNIGSIPDMIGYKTSPTHLKITMGDDYIIEKTILLLFRKKPDIESCTWINKNSVRKYTDATWIAYGRYFYRKNGGDDLWIFDDMFNICKHCYGNNDFITDDILQCYLNYRSRHFPVYCAPTQNSYRFITNTNSHTL